MQQSPQPIDYGEYKLMRAAQQDNLRIQKDRLKPHLEHLETQFQQLRAAIEQGHKVQEDDLIRAITAYAAGLSKHDREWVWFLLPDRDIHGNLAFVHHHYFRTNEVFPE